MKPEAFGYNNKLEKTRAENNLSDFDIGRVVLQHKGRYVVKTEKGDLEAKITGSLRFSAKSREDFPAVGDWVALVFQESGPASIKKIFPRYSVITRQAVKKFGKRQIIAANIDFAFLVQAVDRDFSINRLERYLAICRSSGVEPIIVLTKIDLIEKEEVDQMLVSLKSRIKDVSVVAVSNETQEGYEELKALIEKGKTYCMLGSSGVGKSTLLNNLSGRKIMETSEISEAANRGKHVTSHRELVVLESGGIIIDNPGMREVGIADVSNGLEDTFDKIISLFGDCRFRDCTHTSEIGCAVIDAVEKGEIDRDSYENYIKMGEEEAYFESSVVERKKKDKNLGKLIKNYKKGLNKNKY